MDESGSNPNRVRAQSSTSPSRAETGQARSRKAILVIEDNGADVFLIRESLDLAQIDAEIHVVTDGERAIRFFEAADADPAAPCPDAVILDINLPKKQGKEVLQRMRSSQRCCDAAVLVVTSSDSDQDREAMRRLGATVYFRKPTQYNDYMKLGTLLKELLQAPGV